MDKIISTLQAHGFARMGTGGGCEAMVKQCGNGLSVYVVGDDIDIPSDDRECSVSLHVDGHTDPLAFTVHKTGAELARLFT